jgi:hypothetical protein
MMHLPHVGTQSCTQKQAKTKITEKHSDYMRNSEKHDQKSWRHGGTRCNFIGHYALDHRIFSNELRISRPRRVYTVFRSVPSLLYCVKLLHLY